MDEFVAIILICLNSVPVEQCDDKTALDVQSTVVQNELGCVTGWQDVIARSSLRQDIGTSAYLRTRCERRHFPDR